MSAERASAQYPLAGSTPPPWATEAQVQRATEALMAEIVATRYVGSKHHSVPQFILKRFADERQRVLVRFRGRPGLAVCNIKDLAVADFYTFVDETGSLNSSFEQLWGVIEGTAAGVLRCHLDNPFVVPRPFALAEKQAIDALVALQITRGPAPRRVTELLTDYHVKLTNQRAASLGELRRYEFSPHQNEHLQVMAHTMNEVDRQLSSRAASIVTLDQPLLVTCDEPVCLDRPIDYAPATRQQLRRHPAATAVVDGRIVPSEDVIQIRSPGGVGVADAEAIAMPISPRHAVVYHAPGTAGQSVHRRLGAVEAVEFADELNRLCMEQAVSWIAGNPANATLKTARLPDPLPQVEIIDGGTPFARDVHTATRRAPRRLDRGARRDALVPSEGEESGAGAADRRLRG